MSNPWRDYQENFRANLPSGVTYNSDVARYFFNDKRFVHPWEVEQYRNYLNKTSLLNATAIARLLFSDDEPGFFIDTDDWSTLFQDTAGTTPVTGPNQGVALALDKRLGLKLGPELVTSGVFSEELTFDGTVIQAEIATVGKTYEVTFSLISYTGSGTMRLALGGGTGLGLGRSVPGVYTQYLVAASPSLSAYISAGASATIDNISVRELKGNHATQATTANRPLTARHPEGGVRNEVDGSDALETQTVAVTAQERTLSFRGTGTVTLSGASTAGPLVGTGADDIVSLTFTPTAGNLTLTKSGTVNDAMLEEGAVRTNYQRRVDIRDVTEAGKRSIGRLWFNGTSHWMVTPTITPGTDKAQVFAGVRKLSDAATAALASFGNIDSDSGSAEVLAPSTSGSISYRLGSRGTVLASTPSTTPAFPAPISNVLTALGDISGDRATLRIDSTQVAQSTADQGTGNFLAYSVYIGARAGTSFFYNGFLDQLIGRFGATPDTETIEKVEKYISTKVPEVIL